MARGPSPARTGNLRAGQEQRASASGSCQAPRLATLSGAAVRFIPLPRVQLAGHAWTSEQQPFAKPVIGPATFGPAVGSAPE